LRPQAAYLREPKAAASRNTAQLITPGITPKFRVTRRPVRHSAPSGAGPGALRRFLHSRHQFDHGHDVFDGSLHFCNELIGLREIDARNRRVTQYLTYLFVMFVSGLNLSGSASSYAMHIGIEVSDQMFERRQALAASIPVLSFAFLHDPGPLAQLDQLVGVHPSGLPEQFLNSGSVSRSEPLILIAFQR
jgi:hypothetical protein